MLQTSAGAAAAVPSFGEIRGPDYLFYRSSHDNGQRSKPDFRSKRAQVMFMRGPRHPGCVSMLSTQEIVTPSSRAGGLLISTGCAGQGLQQRNQLTLRPRGHDCNRIIRLATGSTTWTRGEGTYFVTGY